MVNRKYVWVFDLVFVVGTLGLILGFVYFQYFSGSVSLAPPEPMFVLSGDLPQISNSLGFEEFTNVLIPEGDAVIVHFEKGDYYLRVLGSFDEVTKLTFRDESELLFADSLDSIEVFNVDAVSVDVTLRGEDFGKESYNAISTKDFEVVEIGGLK